MFDTNFGFPWYHVYILYLEGLLFSKEGILEGILK